MTMKESKVGNQSDMKHYTNDFFSYYARGARLSAEVIVPLVVELVQPRSVIDIGCGTGEWLAVFREKGVEDIVGVDGPYVNKKLLAIPEERFIIANLEQPFHLDQKFDLVVSLEVAEHLSYSSAETFVNSLTELGPVVLFSAAVPYQRGEHHINEQWPEYWANLFSKKGYVITDPLRSKVWNDERVEYWYIQNTFVFVDQSRLESYPLLSQGHRLHSSAMLSVVHPRLYLERTQEATLHYLLTRKLIYTLTRAASNGLRSILPDHIYRLVRATYRR